MTKEAISTERALRLALEALEGWGKGFPDNWGDLDTEAVTALREALASQGEALASEAIEQPAPATELREQEPVAKKKHEPTIDLGKYAGTYGGYITPEPSEGYLEKAYRLANELRSHLSIAPAQRKPLTDEEIDVLREQHSEGRGAGWRFDFKGFARAIEAKLKEKNQ